MAEVFSVTTSVWSFYLILFLYIVTAIGSVGMFGGWLPTTARIWGKHAELFVGLDRIEIENGAAGFYTRAMARVPFFGTCWSLRWSRAFQISVATLEHAAFMGFLCTLRAAQLVFQGPGIIGHNDILLSIALLFLADSKRRMNRAGSIRGNRTLRWPWYMFNAGVAITAVLVGALAFAAQYE